MASLWASPRALTTTSASSPRRHRALVAAGVSAALATGVLVTGAPAHAEPLPDPLHRDLYLDFDGADLLEALGASDVVATVTSSGGGQVLPGPDRFSTGHSLRLERFRPDEPATPAVVVVRPAAGASDSTEPGSRPFGFGAEFALDAVTGVSDTDNGENLVQRGLFGAGSQYKIQLDDRVPSCRVAGSDGAVVVRADEQVQPEQWYRVRCRRAGDAVTLRVVTSEDGAKDVAQYVAHGPTGTLSYGPDDSPFSIGGKVDEQGHVLTQSSDQFNGLVDDVFFRSVG